MRKRILLIVTILMVLGFAPAPLPRQTRVREVPVGWTGCWLIVASSPLDSDAKLEVANGQLIFISPIGQQTAVYELTLDPTATPPAFKWTGKQGMAFVGSYRLQGNELTLIFSYSPNIQDRPVDFDGRAMYRYVLKRIPRN